MYHGVFRSINNGKSWDRASNGLPHDPFGDYQKISSITIKDTNIFVAVDGTSGGVYFSNNKGVSWVFKSNGLTTNSSIISLTSEGNNIYASTAGNGLYLSTDNGGNWYETSIGSSYSFAKVVKSGANLIALTYNSSGAYLSTNNGVSWTGINGLSFSYIYDIVVNGNAVFIVGDGVFYGSIYKSTDNGVSWNTIGSNPGLPYPNPIIYSLGADGSNIYAGTYTNIYLSSDNGNTWSSSGVVNNSKVNSITINDTCVFAGTDVSGVWVAKAHYGVWPGDANSDGIADNLDVLELGLHYTQIGTPRVLTSNLWQSYYSANWSGTITNGKNLNHSNCNGDGIINDDDTLAIFNNYSLTHAFKPEQTTTNPVLTIIPDQSAVAKGTWGTASINLGNITTPISNINGIAFTVNFDNTLLETDSVWLEYPTSFINASNQNLKFRKRNFTNGKLFTAITHTISGNVSGYGKIATLHYKIKSNLATDNALNVSISQANQSNASGVISPLTSGSATLMAIGASVGINELTDGNYFSVLPNPANDILSIELKTTNDINATIEITNTIGQVVLSSSLKNNKEVLNITQLSNGVYFVKVLSTNKQIGFKKIIVQR